MNNLLGNKFIYETYIVNEAPTIANNVYRNGRELY